VTIWYTEGLGTDSTDNWIHVLDAGGRRVDSGDTMLSETTMTD
jgi:hypothetical protein